MRIPILPHALATRLTAMVARARRAARLAALLSLIFLALATPLAQATDHVTLYVTEAQGTVVAELTPQGAGQPSLVTYEAAYRPYGQQALGVPQAGPGYTGHVNDPDSGLVYMQARYYDPLSMRFLSVDPVGPTPGNIFNFNRYAYANNNPIVNIDPDGRESPCVEVPNGCSEASPGTKAVSHAIGQFMIGVGKKILNQLPNDAGETDLKPSNSTQAFGMVGGDLIVGAVVTVVTEGDGAEVSADVMAADISTAEKMVYRLGDSAESASRLGRKSAEAEGVFGHGVSVSTTQPAAGISCSSASCSSLEMRGFEVRPTPTRNDPNHHTVILPKPVTKGVAKDFNDAFGRG